MNKTDDVQITGGQAGARGYLVQTLVAVLEGLRPGHDFVCVTLEPESQWEKVDIVWQYANRHRAVQVKSSCNQFSEAEVRRWAAELEGKHPNAEYELCLVGVPSKGVANLDRIGKVTIVLEPLVLDRPGALEPLYERSAHRLDTFLRSQNLGVGTGGYRRMLASLLADRLAGLSPTGTPMSRAQLVAQLREWVLDFRLWSSFLRFETVKKFFGYTPHQH